MTATEARIETLERALRRQRRVGAAALLLLLTLGAAQRGGAGELEARSLTIVGEGGQPLARLSGGECGRLELLDAEGRRRGVLGEDPGSPGTTTLWLQDAGAGSELELIAGPGRAATLWMGHVEEPRTHLWASISPDASRLDFAAAGMNSGVALGARKDDELFGGWLSMHYARPMGLAGETVWATDGTYFRVSPDERIDRPAAEIRRMVPD